MSKARPLFTAIVAFEFPRILYRIEKQQYSFNIKDILLVGEFSAEPNSFAADYFFTFLVKNQQTPIDIPAYAEGLFETLESLRQHLPGLGHPKLQMSTEFRSNTLFPASWAGKPYYEFIPETRPIINLPFFRKLAQVETIGKQIRASVRAGLN